MIPKIKDYKGIIGDEMFERIKAEAEPLQDKHITHVNSTYMGGGVAEILNTMIPLQNTLGIETGWRLIKGSHSFFSITKKFHNALQGEEEKLSAKEKEIYIQEIARNSLMTHFRSHDLVMIHDPQALAMISYSKKRQPWVWRCHIDISSPYMPVWDFLKPYINKYDGVIVSRASYRKKDIIKPHFFIPPSIDPLSLKNKELTSTQAQRILAKNGIDTDKPIITQISRFDKWKNPLGVVKMFEKVHRKHPSKLILMGDMATDDPEGPKIYSKIVKKTDGKKDVMLITKKDDLLVNALQKCSHIILQNSKREGFALTVSEALWKGTPVIGTNVGGIPLQIKQGKTGFLINNTAEGVKRTIQLLEDDKLRTKLGKNGREHVRKNFLITRGLLDHLLLANYYINKKVPEAMMVRPEVMEKERAP